MITNSSTKLYSNESSTIEIYREGSTITFNSPLEDGYIRSHNYKELMETIEYNNTPFIQSIFYMILWFSIFIICIYIILKIPKMNKLFIPLTLLSFSILLYNIWNYFKKYKNHGLLLLSENEQINSCILISKEDYKNIITTLESLRHEI